MDIWETAVKLSKQQQPANSSNASAKTDLHLILIGSKSAGKSTICRKYVDRKPPDSKNSAGINYSFISRQSDEELAVRTGHIWEIGSTLRISDYLQIILDSRSISDFAIFMACDLSKPEYLISALQHLISELVAVVVRSKQSPSEIWIVGTRFDLFQAFEVEKKQRTTDLLRHIATHFNFGLIYFSVQLPAAELKIKTVLDAWFFKSQFNAAEVQKDPSKLVLVPPSGKEPRNLTGNSAAEFEKWKSVINQTIPQKSDPGFAGPKDDTESKLYHEPEINAVYDTISLEVRPVNGKRK